jgi:predicted nucleotidyltransferase
MVVQPVAYPKNRPLPEWYTPVTAQLLRQMTRRIVDAFEPEKIVLFGSYAYGQPTVHSDVDLLVITRAMGKESIFARNRAISALFPHRRFGLDILVRTPEEIRARLAIGDEFIQRIIEHGSVLYERRQRRRMGPRSRDRLQKRSRSRTKA